MTTKFISHIEINIDQLHQKANNFQLSNFLKKIEDTLPQGIYAMTFSLWAEHHEQDQTININGQLKQLSFQKKLLNEEDSAANHDKSSNP